LTILVAHEMGHYLNCRKYGIPATLPHLIPAPPFIPPPFFIPLNLFGTFGAVIKIKSTFYSRRQLFDVGIGGPLAGFLLAAPVLFVGLSLSREFAYEPSSALVMVFGESLLFKLGVALFFSGDPAHLNLHPIGWAAWFGLLATSLNLLPLGQLDGGHVVYSIFGPRCHRIISFATLALLAVLGIFYWLGYLVFGAVITIVGFRHPPVVDDSIRLRGGRLVLAALALLVLVLTFVPAPVDFVESVRRL
jgi:membrane-associated protease RseP (regulator of RpoE activity)